MATKPNGVILYFLFAVLFGLGGWQIFTTHQLAIHVRAMNDLLVIISKTHVSKQELKIWAEQIQVKNPNLNVPDPVESTKGYHVPLY